MANEGGFLDAIRCDEKEYLVWKWSPTGKPNSSQKENTIRWGSTLRVKDGELAVFVYKQNSGQIQDFFVGPQDITLKTANLPVLASFIGLVSAGSSPFQAEVYFINLSGNLQIRFGIPYFDLYDPRFPDLGVPCAVRGTLTFNLTDHLKFIKLNRLISFELEDLKKQIKDTFIRKAKSIIINLPKDDGFTIMQIEKNIDNISDKLKDVLNPILQDDFGINLKRLDISAIELDKDNNHYRQLKRITVDQQSKVIETKTNLELTNLEEIMRIQRKEVEFGVEARNFTVHQLNQQTDVLKTAAQNLGSMGNIGGGDGSGGFNPAGLAAGMIIGGGVGSQISGMMQNMRPASSVPPVLPQNIYHISVNGNQAGPFTIQQLRELVSQGQFNKSFHVWTQGMANWDLAGNIKEINDSLFMNSPPPPPPPAPPGTST